MGGKVVRARRGERHAYLPVVSQLCRSSAPLAVVQALLELYPFTRLYIADLDAIQGIGTHQKTIATIRNHFPGLDIWLDAGIASITEWQAWQSLELQCVIGSESQASMESAQQLIKHIGVDRAVLSLDTGQEGRRGPNALFTASAYWPEKIIAMTLARVGSQQGPDWEALDGMQAGTHHIYAAGGVRNAADLLMLKRRGMAGVLVASALHDGVVDRETLTQLAGTKKPP